eukprot:2713116-Rhodomonas_salina.5
MVNTGQHERHDIEGLASSLRHHVSIASVSSGHRIANVSNDRLDATSFVSIFSSHAWQQRYVSNGWRVGRA